MINLNKDQEAAIQFLKNWWTSESRFALLQGAAGTGKTFLINYLVKVLPNCYPVFTAPTNEACRQLELSLDKDSFVKTTYSLLGFSMSTCDEVKQLKQRRPLAIIDDFNLLIVDECFHPDTELLTARGFVKIAEVTMQDLVASLDVKTGLTYFDKPVALIEKDYNGYLYSYQGQKTLSYSVTENHDCLVIDANSCFVKRNPGKIKSNDRFYLTAKSGIVNDIKLTWLDKLRIAFQADGGYTSNGLYSGRFSNRGYTTDKVSITFSFTKERKIKAFAKILKNLDFEWNIVNNTTDTQKTIIRVSKVPANLISKSLNEVFSLENVSASYARDFIYEVVNWDGYTPEHRDYLYYSSTVESNVDFCQAMAALAGFKTNKTVQIDTRKETYLKVYRLFITDNVFSGSYSNYKAKVKKEWYLGKVNCITMPLGTVITRKDGLISASGNCSFVDEALFSAIEGTNLKILFIGHSKQLPGVDVNLQPDSSCDSLVFFKDFPTYTLGTPERATGDLYNFITSLETLIESKIKVFRGMYNTDEIALLNYIHSEEGKAEFLNESTKLLCYTNRAVDNWNTVIRKSIFGKNCAEIVVKDKLILTSPVKYIGIIEEKASRQKLLNEKNKAVQLSTNTKLTVLRINLKRVLTIDCHELLCETIDGKVIIYVPISKEQFNKFLYSLKSECFTKTTSIAKAKAWETYHYIHSLFAEAKYSYAMTVHRSQGSTIPDTIVNWKDIQVCKNLTLRYKLLYVACSRAKNNLKIVC